MKTTTGTSITGHGVWHPPTVLTNEELCTGFNEFVRRDNAKHADAIAAGKRTALQLSTPEFIVKASGIKQRYVQDKTGLIDPERMCPNIPDRREDELSYQAEYAVNAANQALAVAGRTGEDVDLVVLGASNLQRLYPALAIEVQHALGALAQPVAPATPRNTNNGGGYGTSPRGNRNPPDYVADGPLTGTYRRDAVRSDDVNNVASRAARSVPVRERTRLSESLVTKLAAGDDLLVQQRGTVVLVGAPRTATMEYEADGRVRAERAPNGATMRTTVTLRANRLEVRTASDRNESTLLSMETIDGGRALRVIRQVVDTRIPQPVSVVSVYEKVSATAQLDPVRGNNDIDDNTDDTFGNGSASGNTAGRASDEFLIGNGVAVMALLNQDISTKTARERDPFSMTVRTPQQYEGAVIEGYVSGLTRSGRVSGRSRITFNFERIRLLDGTTYRFTGTLETVMTASGERVQIDPEGTVSDSENRTTTTAKRAGVGTAVGAAIGAIAGGGKGAAIGAIIGAGGGAGSVYAEGRDELELLRGAEVTIRASAPRIN